MQSDEAVLSSAASMAVGFHEDTTPEVLRVKDKQKELNLICCVTKTGEAWRVLEQFSLTQMQPVAAGLTEQVPQLV